MNSNFLNNLRKIRDDDERIVTITLLIDIISNLITDKINPRHQTLPQSYIQEMFEKYQGAMECLDLIGFQKINNDYVFNQTTSIDKLQEIVKLLENELDPIGCSEKLKSYHIDLGIVDDQSSLISFPRIQIPSQFNELIPFLSTIKLVQSYEDKHLRQYILSSIIPIENFHRKIFNRTNSININKRDLLLIELLRWFKEDFFTWFNGVQCDRCQISMNFSEYTQPTNEERQIGHANRVELYRCPTCSSDYRFPRYNSPLKLLETRTGRCGEAANLFTCLCRALSFQSRYIHDPTDHVWTEVYSESEHRWLHCDACENLCDSPLVYEKGWKKDLTYCIAFAKDHIQDVTWRYVTNFKQTKQRRNINEKLFVKLIHRINQNIQRQLNEQEKKKVISMQIEDLVNMLTEEKATKESELHGRQSGSLAWKLSRGEIDNNDMINGYIYHVNQDECEKGSILIEYNSIKDIYYRNKNEENKSDGWIDRIYSCSNIQRKIERDWKMVYLSRKQLNSNGFLSWSIQLNSEQDKSYRFDKIQIQCPSTTFDQYAKVLYQLQIGENSIVDLSQNLNSSFEYVFDGQVSSVSFKVILTSTNDNNDDNAWQKAQLFRHSIEQVTDDDQSYFLKLNLLIRKKDFN